MWSKLLHLCGFYRLESDVESYLDKSNAKTAIIISSVTVLLESVVLIMTFTGAIRPSNSEQALGWFLRHRLAYSAMILASVQLLIVSAFEIRKNIPHILMLSSILVMLFVCIFFGIYISLLDYNKGEQILVFVTIALIVSCAFFIKPYLSAFLITFYFAFFYVAMRNSSVGISAATRVNYPVLWFLDLALNYVRYENFLHIAEKTLANEKLSKQLLHISMYDTLTQVKNRYALRNDFSSALNKELFVMLADVDDFKGFNDGQGHDKGDEILQKFADSLKTSFGNEFCYRYGGDEFLVMIPNPEKGKFLKSIQNCYDMDKNFHFSGGYTVGIAHKDDDLRELIAQADKNLYKAKRNGKNQTIGD